MTLSGFRGLDFVWSGANRRRIGSGFAHPHDAFPTDTSEIPSQAPAANGAPPQTHERGGTSPLRLRTRVSGGGCHHVPLGDLPKHVPERTCIPRSYCNPTVRLPGHSGAGDPEEPTRVPRENKPPERPGTKERRTCRGRGQAEAAEKEISSTAARTPPSFPIRTYPHRHCLARLV